MPIVFIPPASRELAGGVQQVEVTGQNVGQVIDALEEKFPGMRSRLCSDEGLRPGISVTVNDQVGVLGLHHPTPADCEIHFLPALGGG
ncbi:MoaD/ThiS family protein [Lignipirellula cremea]|uniref:ThiS family protein n=1 Tax=Lignipirellula cremea TaxID=2528010 RepID=A0A518DNC6_9BACT|nr:MoaD/ThiS family protein [Lignipirellula cremea]QDU93331.1 ThiS family protein [Lignipirellula cremea]